MLDVQIFPNKGSLTQAALEKFVALAEESIRERGVFSVALSGGSTPKALYQSLAVIENYKGLSWKDIHFFWGDERHVSHSHPDSNFRMVNESLFDKISLPRENIHRVPAELDARMAAFHYEEELRKYFSNCWPQFDLVLLGMGEDGHTASLFPHSSGLQEEKRWFIANFAPGIGAWRLTLTKNAINQARHIIVLVSGGNKSQMVAKVLEEPKRPEERPIQLICPQRGKMQWLLDGDAAKCLSGQFRSRVALLKTTGAYGM
jgi:6-phosphogluconolactonase